jgi:hypothetical protein
MTILGAIVIFLIVLGAAALVIGLHYSLFFLRKKCKHCNHVMEYKGLKEDNKKGHYLFHCEHCGAWEQVPKEEFFRQCDNPIENL